MGNGRGSGIGIGTQGKGIGKDIGSGIVSDRQRHGHLSRRIEDAGGCEPAGHSAERYLVIF
jgi:hypothetical protein